MKMKVIILFTLIFMSFCQGISQCLLILTFWGLHLNLSRDLKILTAVPLTLMLITLAAREGVSQWPGPSKNAEKTGLQVSISVPLLRDNLDQMAELRNVPEIAAAGRYSYFLPHSKGRGRNIQDQRITKQEFEQLPEEVRASFQKVKHMKIGRAHV